MTITGTWSGTLTLQKSFVDEFSSFSDVTTYTSNTSVAVTDSADNTAIWYKIGFKDGDYTSGSAVVNLEFGVGGGSGGVTLGAQQVSTGGRYGLCRVVAYTSSTQVSVDTFDDFSSDVPSTIWWRGQWNEQDSWPSSLDLHEGRLFHSGKNELVGSVSDAYSSFALDVTGDSGPIQRSIGYGPVVITNGLVSGNRLLVMTEGSEAQVKSSSFDEPLTPTNFSIKDISTFGSARIPPVKVDDKAYFAHRSGLRLMEIAFSAEKQDYNTRDLNFLHPDMNLENPITKVVVQRMPDTRFHCVRSDGTVAVLLYEPASEVAAWVRVETSGEVEDAYVLPGTVEDTVYYVVKRAINGATVRYHEKWALENECIGGSTSKLMDCSYTYSGVSTALITGLTHLEGESVIVWGNGKYLGAYTVSTGSITLYESVTSCTVGLAYTAEFKSARLAYGAQMGTALAQQKRIHSLGLLMENTHYQGLLWADNFDTMYNLPLVENGTETAENYIWSNYDERSFPLDGQWNTDSRLCLKAQAPYPVTVLAAVIGMETNDK